MSNKKDSYASYILCKKKRMRGKHGSSILETNHASILVNLNDGSIFFTTNEYMLESEQCGI